MEISTPLLLKGLAGAAGVAAVSTGGVYLYNPEIFGIGVLSAEEKFNNELIKYVDQDHDIAFTLQNKDGGQIANGFPSWEEGKTDVSVTAKVSKDSLKGNNPNTSGFKSITGSEDISWECELVFKRPQSNTNDLLEDTKNKLFKSDSPEGFLNKLKKDTTSTSESLDSNQKLEIKKLKKQFIRNCSGSKNNQAQSSDKSFKYTKTFELIQGKSEQAGKTDTSKNYFEDDEEFSKWFEGKLTTKERQLSSKNSWSLSTHSDNTVRLKVEGMLNCLINLSGKTEDSQKLKNELSKKIEENNPWNKKYRNGLIKACKSNGDILDFSIPKTGEINISGLFDFSDETVDDGSILLGAAWTIEPKVNDKAITIGVKINHGGKNYLCQIIGKKDSSITGEFDSKKLEDSSDPIKTTLEGKINPADDTNKKSARTKFLTKCKKAFDEKVDLELKLNSDQSKYEPKEPNNLFT